MILQSQISKLSNRLLKENGGRRIPMNGYVSYEFIELPKSA